MQVEMKTQEIALHIVDKFAIPEQPQLFIGVLCGEDIAMSDVKSSAHEVNWRWRTYPRTEVCVSKNLCAECVKECKRLWYRKQREHNVPPTSIRNCRNILRSIQRDISRTSDLEKLASLGRELQATSNSFRKTAPDLLHKEQKERCALCKERQRNRKNMSLDHIVPSAKGGATSLRNLQLVCRACNEEKGTTDNDEFISRLKAAGRIVED